MNKAVRIAKSLNARTRRSIKKSIVAKRTSNLYNKIRRARKASK